MADEPRSGRGIRSIVERLLRVPPRPEPPAGSPGSVRVFRAAPGFYRYKLVQWFLGQVGAAWGLVVGLVFIANIPEQVPVRQLMTYAEILGVVGFVLQLPLTFLLVKVDYDYRWYVVTDRSLRIREGVVRVREQTMSFANIQNLSTRQGPLQRLFGIEDLRVRTAGGGGKESDGEGGQGSAGHNLHLGYFRGVDRAGEIRDTILRRLRTLRDAGLGDPKEVPAPADEPPAQAAAAPPSGPVPASDSATSAARELLAEARKLRLELSNTAG